MFGYHESNHCRADFWAPEQFPGPAPHPQSDEGCAVENRAFSPYVLHTQTIEDIINGLVNQVRMGNTDITINTLGEKLSEEDINYIYQEVYRRV